MLSGLFGLNGRIGRGTWWLGHLILVPLMIFVFVTAAAGVAAKSTALMSLASLSMFIFLVALIPCCYISVATTIQRFHDRGKAGWWFWISFVPIIGPLWLWIECGFCSGDEGDNEYGPPPGAGRRMASLNREVSDVAASSGVLAKLDDDYLANYAKKIAMQQATQQMAAASSFGQNNNGRPAFGKR